MLHPTVAQCRRHWVIVASGFTHHRRHTNGNNRAGIPISTCYVLLCLFLVSLMVPSMACYSDSAIWEELISNICREVSRHSFAHLI